MKDEPILAECENIFSMRSIPPMALLFETMLKVNNLLAGRNLLMRRMNEFYFKYILVALSQPNYALYSRAISW